MMMVDRLGPAAANRLLRRLVLLVLVIVSLPIVAACDGNGDAGGSGASAGDLTVHDVWMRPAPAGGSTAAYMVVLNQGDEDDTLLGVAFPDAERVEIHETVMEGDIARMIARPDGLILAAGTETALAPMGKHVMVVDLARPLEDGATEMLLLRFEKAGEMSVPATVQLGP